MSQPKSNANSQTGKSFWGPDMWKVIHYFSMYHSNTKAFIAFLWCLTRLLPCEVCRGNLIKKLEKYPIDAYTRTQESMFYYGYIIHDLVNKTTDKKSPAFDNVKFAYSKLKFNDIVNPLWNMIHIIAITSPQGSEYYFREFLLAIIGMLPNAEAIRYKHFMETYPIESYLRNHSDSFFYTYLFRQNITRTELPPYLKLKSYYSSGVGVGCKDCKV